MENDHPMWYSTGSHCAVKVHFEDWESKYTPADWSTSDLFDTLQQCCATKFWSNPEKCIAESPKDMVFDFTFDLTALIEPQICQDADIIGNALEVALNKGLGGGDANVTKIGCVTMSRDPDTGNPRCGGCLAGTTFSGDYDGTRTVDYYAVNETQVTEIAGE